jgi:hypothetical protein
MAHYAKVNNGLVEQVIVAESEFFNTFIDTSPGKWIQTSYNTHGGVHKLDGTPLRYNYAGVGFTYDEARDAFIPPKLYPSWVLNEDSCLWEPPVPYPDADSDERYEWNEENQTWDEI